MMKLSFECTPADAYLLMALYELLDKDNELTLSATENYECLLDEAILGAYKVADCLSEFDDEKVSRLIAHLRGSAEAIIRAADAIEKNRQ